MRSAPINNRLLTPFPQRLPLHSCYQHAVRRNCRQSSASSSCVPSRESSTFVHRAGNASPALGFPSLYVLPPQVLSRRNQLLIEKLAQTALVTPPLPVARETIFGVVERARTKAPEVGRVIPMRGPEPVRSSATARGSATVSTVAAKYSAPNARDGGFRQWRALGLPAAVCLLVVLARVPAAFWPAERPLRRKLQRYPGPSSKLRLTCHRRSRRQLS